MEILCISNEGILAVLKRYKKNTPKKKLQLYCLRIPLEHGTLLFNLLTRTMCLLKEEEWQNRFENEYFNEHLFFVPEEANEKEYADLVRWVLETRQKKSKHITGYTIFPTTDCNARCFYCFELGRDRVPMSKETAEKAADYIKAHCGGEKIKLNWFGGEPLYNQEAI